VADWVRREFGGVGVTQAPPGKHLCVLQAKYLGHVILCIDVSSSMGMHEHGRSRLQHAVAGAERFVAEAVEAHYDVGLILWNHNVSQFVPMSADGRPVLQALRRAGPSGGTNVTPALKLGIEQLSGMSGDRVLAIFGDGDIGPVEPAVAASRRASTLGIRIIVRGLGEYAAASLRQIATEPEDLDSESDVVTSAAGIEAGISSMMRTITAVGRRSASS
jgi:uncharacterized protein (DUF58 family)